MTYVIDHHYQLFHLKILWYFMFSMADNITQVEVRSINDHQMMSGWYALRDYMIYDQFCWFVVLAGTLTIALSLCLWQCFWSIIVQWLKMKCKICCRARATNCVIGGSHRHRLAVSLPIICKHENKNKNTNTNTNWSLKNRLAAISANQSP